MNTPEALYLLGVKAALFNPAGQLLLMNVARRTGNETYWDLPGGQTKAGETPVEGLRREVIEETGIAKFEIGEPLVMTLTNIRLPVGETTAGLIMAVYRCSTTTTQLVTEPRMVPRWCNVPEAVELLKTNPGLPADFIQAVSAL